MTSTINALLDISWDSFSQKWKDYYHEKPSQSIIPMIPKQSKTWACFYKQLYIVTPHLKSILWSKLKKHVHKLKDAHKTSLFLILSKTPPLGRFLFSHFNLIFDIKNNSVFLKSRWKKMATNLWLASGGSWKKINHYAYDHLLYQCILGTLSKSFDVDNIKKNVRKIAPCTHTNEWINASDSASIYFDGGFDHSTGCGKAAFVAVNNFGLRLVYIEDVENILDFQFLNGKKITSISVEAIAFYRACELANKLTFPHTIYGDCLSVIDDFKKTSTNIFHSQTIEPFSPLKNQVFWIPRLKNAAADFWTH